MQAHRADPGWLRSWRLRLGVELGLRLDRFIVEVDMPRAASVSWLATHLAIL